MYLSLCHFFLFFCFILIISRLRDSFRKREIHTFFLHSHTRNARHCCIIYYTPLYLHVSRYIVPFYPFFSIRHIKISDDEKKYYFLLSSIPRTDYSIWITLQVPTARINLLSMQLSLISSKNIIQKYLYYTTSLLT